MRVFKIDKRYRTVGVGYGLPMFHVEFGVSLKKEPTQVIEEMSKQGLGIGSWVVLQGEPLLEQGVGVLVEGLKACRVHVEVEEVGDKKLPGWFTKADRWVIEWIKDGQINYGALRSRQDMLICSKEDKIEEYIKSTEKAQALRAVVVEDIKKVWDLVKDTNVRVYRKE